MWQSDKMHPPKRPPVVSEVLNLPRVEGATRTRLTWEVWIVLAITVGQSAVYSILSFVRSLIRAAQQNQSLSQQQTQLNPNRDAEAIWNAVYQLLSVFFALSLVALVVYLLWEPGKNALRRIGLDFSRFGGDLGRALLLGLVIGIPGLALYVAGARSASPSR